MARITDDRLKKDFQADLLEYWRILVKRRWAILSVVTILAVLSLIYSFTATPVYKAISNIMIEEPTSSVLTLQDILSQSGSSNGLTTTFFNTQLKILGSRTLAERVAKKMNLAARPELQAPVRRSSSSGKDSILWRPNSCYSTWTTRLISAACWPVSGSLW